jgi:P4 family phage/plasmid primase-like protien
MNVDPSLADGRPLDQLPPETSPSGNSRLVAELEQSAIGPEHLARLRYRWVSREEAHQLTGYKLTGWAVPYLDPCGTPYPSPAPSGEFWRLKPDPGQLKPKDGEKPPKYLTTKDAGNRPYLSPLVDWQRRLMGDKPIDITEGEKCADSANAHGHPTIGLAGVYGWKDKRNGESQPISELLEMNWKHRTVRIVFDSDVSINRHVQTAIQSLALIIADLKGKNDSAQPEAVLLPFELNGEKNGVDDLIARHGAEAYNALLRITQQLVRWGKCEGKDVPIGCLRLEPAESHHKAVMAWVVMKDDFAVRTGMGVYRWDGTHWRLQTGKDAEALGPHVHHWMDHQGWHHRGTSTMSAVLGELAHRLRRENATWDPPHLLGFANGTLNTNTNTFSPGHCRDDLLTFCLPYDYEPFAECPRWLAFLEETFQGDQQLIRLARAAIRWSVMPKDTTKPFPYEVLLDVIGRKATGKGTFSEVLNALVGRTHGAAILKPEGIANANTRHGLIGKRIAFDPDCGGHVRDPGTFNSIISNEPVEVKALYRDVFSARLGVVVWRFFNDTPGASGGGVEGLGRRIITFQFKVKPARRDPSLKAALIAEVAGIFMWVWAMDPKEMGEALMGAGSIASIMAASLDGALERQPILRFLLEQFSGGHTGILAARLYQQWTAWCEAEGHAKCSNTTFAKELKKLDGITSTHTNGGNVYRIPSITLSLLADHLGLSSDVPPEGVTNSPEDDVKGLTIHCEGLAESTLHPETPALEGVSSMVKGMKGLETKEGFSQKMVSRNGMEKDLGQNPSDPSPSCDERSLTLHSSLHQPFTAPPNPSPPPHFRGLSIDVQDEKTSTWEPGWRQIGTGKGSVNVLCSDPAGHSRQVRKDRIRPAMGVAS